MNKNRIAGIILIVLAIGVGLNFYFEWVPFTGGSSSDAYQAVFLSNNQVYFGKLSNQNSQYPVLRDIYYLQVTQPLQPSSPQPNVNLVKLGSELHGPVDEMVINRDHILFIEDLKPESQVVAAIESTKAQAP